MEQSEHLRGQDSNLRPLGHEPSELTGLLNPAKTPTPGKIKAGEKPSTNPPASEEGDEKRMDYEAMR